MPETRWLTKNRIYFSQFWRLGGSRSRALHMAAFLLHHPKVEHGGKEHTCAREEAGLIPSSGTPIATTGQLLRSMTLTHSEGQSPQHFPTSVRSQCSMPWGLSFLHVNFGGHSRSTAGSKSVLRLQSSDGCEYGENPWTVRFKKSEFCRNTNPI